MCLLNGRLLNHLHLMFVSCKWWRLVFILAFAVRLHSHISKLIKPTDGQALNLIILVIMHHNNTYHFHIQVCYSNVIVLSHVSLICVNILMARNMESFDRVTGLCVISQITYFLRPNHSSVHKKQFKPYEMKHNRWHATQATITFNLFLFSFYFLSLYVDWLKAVCLA